MHEFDMQALLAAFDNDPEKLAKSFTDQLNTALAIKRREEEVKEAAEKLSHSWNDFIDDYFDVYHQDMFDNRERYYFNNGDEVIAIIEMIIQALPEIEKSLKMLENLDLMTDKLKDSFEEAKQCAQTAYTSAKETIEPTADDFKKSMKDFFHKYGI